MLEPLIPIDDPPCVRRPGSVHAVFKSNEVVVWLIGELDISIGPELDELAEEAPRVANWLTIDASRVTYCDTTFLRFIAEVSEDMFVSVRRPSTIFTDILALSGLARRVRVESAS
jgi:anti-anti-sigma regulatory factor